jgi:hypothetical protein
MWLREVFTRSRGTLIAARRAWRALEGHVVSALGVGVCLCMTGLASFVTINSHNSGPTILMIMQMYQGFRALG